ncbi:MAG: ParB/RepB/Spo0J family partition protein [Clostridiaceae bacterium]
MNKKHGLGKGLGALIPEELSKDIEDNSIFKIDLNLIKANEEQPRKNFDESKILVLAESIKEHGIIQPLVLKKSDDNYIIIAGERRWRAAKKLGLKEVPAVILDLSDKEVLEVSLIENIQREDLNPIEEAFAYEKLINQFNLTQETLSKRIGKSRTAITNCLRLLNLDSRVKEYIIDGVISEGHGRALLACKSNDDQFKYARQVIDEKLSVRETEKLVNAVKKLKKPNIIDEAMHPYIKDIETKLEGIFGTKVKIDNKKNKGKIEIQYYSQDDLERIIEILEL